VPPRPPAPAPFEVFDPLRNPELHRGPVEILPRNFRMGLEERVRAAAGAPAWMRRARRLERRRAELLAALEEAWRASTPEAWPDRAQAWDLGAVNGEIESYNAYFPIERSLPMDPALRDYTLGGQPWHPEPLLDAAWIIARFPAAQAGGAARSR